MTITLGVILLQPPPVLPKPSRQGVCSTKAMPPSSNAIQTGNSETSTYRSEVNKVKDITKSFENAMHINNSDTVKTEKETLSPKSRKPSTETDKSDVDDATVVDNEMSNKQSYAWPLAKVPPVAPKPTDKSKLIFKDELRKKYEDLRVTETAKKGTSSVYKLSGCPVVETSDIGIEVQEKENQETCGSFGNVLQEKYKTTELETMRNPYENKKVLGNSIRNFFISHPYFSGFPTEDLLREAQDYYRRQNLISSLDGDGVVIPHPTPSSKEELLAGRNFEDIDQRALCTPYKLYKEDLTGLVEYLTASSANDIDRFRGIFRWITAQNISNWTINNGAYETKSPGWYLNKLKQKELSASNLLQDMCEIIGVKCRIVKGVCKVGDTVMTRAICSEGLWETVLLNGSWRLSNVYWASCHMSEQGSLQWELIDDGTGSVPKKEGFGLPTKHQRYEDFFFLTDPEQFIFTHLPDDERMQMLARPVSKEEFEKLPIVKGIFFHMKMKAETHTQVFVRNDTGEEEMRFTYPKHVYNKFMHRFYRSTQHTKQFEINPDGYVYLENKTIQHVLRILINFPRIGRYKLELYGCNTASTSTSYSLMAIYLFECTTVGQDVKPLPKNVLGEWGPGEGTRNFGIVPTTHESGRVIAKDGEAEIRFHVPNDVRFATKFHRLGSNRTNIELKGYVVYRIEGNVAIFNLRVPQEGEYTLMIYASRDRHMKNFINVCNYLVHSADLPINDAPFLDDSHGYLGPTEEFYELGLFLENDASPFIVAPSSGEANMTFGLTKDRNIDFQTHLHIQSNGGKADFSDYITHCVTETEVNVTVRFPEHGTYSATVFGRKESDNGTLKMLYRGVIEVYLPSKLPLPLPQLNCTKQQGIRLMEPEQSQLVANETYNVSITCANACDVACIDTKSNNWKYLKKSDVRTWVGEVSFSSVDSDIYLSACLDDSESFTAIYTFQTISKLALEEKQAAHQKSYDKALIRYRSLIEEGSILVSNKKDSENEGSIQRLYGEGDIASASAITKARLEETINKLRNEENQGYKVVKQQEGELEVEKDQSKLEDRLKSAMHLSDISKLRKEIALYKQCSNVSDSPTFKQAEELLKILTFKEELKNAVQKRELETLRTLIETIEKADQHKRHSQFLEAKEKMNKLAILSSWKSAFEEGIGKLDQPPEDVHKVITATLLLLGYCEDELKDWTNCRQIYRKNHATGVITRLEKFDVSDVIPQVAVKVQSLLEDVDKSRIEDSSFSTRNCFEWAKIVTEVVSKND